LNDQTTTEKPPFVLSDKVYIKVKWLIVIVLPSLGTLYFALSQIWGWPNGEHVLGSVIAVQAFLGGIFAISTQQYNNSDARFDGTIVTTEHADGGKTASLEFDQHPQEVLNKKEVTLKIAPKQPVAP